MQKQKSTFSLTFDISAQSFGCRNNLPATTQLMNDTQLLEASTRDCMYASII